MIQTNWRRTNMKRKLGDLKWAALFVRAARLRVAATRRFLRLRNAATAIARSQAEAGASSVRARRTASNWWMFPDIGSSRSVSLGALTVLYEGAEQRSRRGDTLLRPKSDDRLAGCSA